MTNILKVVKPFFVMEPGDTLELSKDGMYVSSYESEYNALSADDADVSSVYSSKYSISPSYAAQLIKEGFLVEDRPQEMLNTTRQYVNVFDEIDTLLGEYRDDLENLDTNCEDCPACLKVEQETVLSNLVKVLEHLQSLKK